MPYDSRKRSLTARRLWRTRSYRRKMLNRKPVAFWKGKKLSKNHRKAISDGGKGRKFSRRHRRLIGEANSRRVWTERSKRRTSRAIRKIMRNKRNKWLAGSANRGKSTWNKGKHWSPEVIEKIFSKVAKHPNGLEKAFIKILKKLKIKYKFNTPIENYAPDFIVKSKSGRKFIFETDGRFWHQNKRHTKLRDKSLRKLGYKVIHFWEDEVRKSPDKVAAKIMELLESNS